MDTELFHDLEDYLIPFVEATLDDDHGISTDAFDKLMDLLSHIKNYDTTDRFVRLFDLANQAHATEGRYYLPVLEEV